VRGEGVPSIRKLFAPPTATITTADITICKGGSVKIEGTVTATGIWTLNINGVQATVVTPTTFSLTVFPTATQTYKIDLLTDESLETAVLSGDIEVVVAVNDITPGAIAGDQTVCNGGNPAAFTEPNLATGTGALTYIWQSAPPGASPSWTTISGATSATYDVPTGLAASTQYQRIAISTLNGVACQATSNAATISINNVTAGVIAGAQTVCNAGDPTAFTESSPASGTALSYQWQSAPPGASPVWSDISGATSSSYDIPAGLTTSTQYRRIVTSTLNGVACQAQGNALTISVNNVTAGIIAGAQTICAGADPTAFTVTTPASGSTLTYQWQSGSDGINYSNISLATSSTYDPPAGITNTTYYRRIAISTLNSVPCSANSNDIIVTVNSVTPGVISGSQSVCPLSDPAAFTETTAATGTALTYQWQSSPDGTTAWTNITGATLATYDPPAGITTTTYYRRIVTSTLNGTCTATSNVVNVTVYSNIPEAEISKSVQRRRCQL
jgi:hypothetical protein